MRLLPFAALAAGLVACQPAAPAPTPERDLSVTLAAPPTEVVPRVVALFESAGLPVTAAEGGVVTAAFGPHQGLTTYQITARAVVVPVGAGSRVALRAEQVTGAAGEMQSTRALGPGEHGRAAQVWAALVAVRDSLSAGSGH